MNDHDRGSGLTRRDFLRQAGLVSLAGLAGWRALEAAQPAVFSAKNPLATVVLVRNQGALKKGLSPDGAVVKRMVSEGVEKLMGAPGAAAWGRLFRPTDVVGVKFSRCGYMRVPTRQEVIDGVTAGLTLAGVKQDNVRSADYGLPADQCSALVNVTSLKAHPLTGFAAAIKNYINFDAKPDRFHHESGGKLGEVWLRPEIKGKTRLVVIDLLTPYFGAGPQIDPRYQADYRGILVATDPVAADTVVLSLCQRMRDRYKGKPWPLNPPPLFLTAADREYHLGTADPARIKLVRVGWREGMLV